MNNVNLTVAQTVEEKNSRLKDYKLLVVTRN